jgi:peptidoglycan/LPS O-acetylase OafA/YrhL
MSASSIHDTNMVANFYFCRLRRLLPTYFFGISLTLITTYLLLPPTEFEDIVKDAKPALLFTSAKSHRDTYFDLQSKYLFFLHTWLVLPRDEIFSENENSSRPKI